MWWKRTISLLVLMLILTAQSCGQQASSAKIGQTVITTDINLDNSPVMEMNKVVNVSPQIYASVEIVNGSRIDNVQVVWENKTSKKIIATEFFEGRYSATRPHEFKGDRSPTTSWLSSSITLEDFSWPLGEYLITVILNNSSQREVSFEIISESDYEKKIKENLIKNITFGKEINSRNQVISPSDSFLRTDENIYASILFSKVPENTQFKVNWEFLETGQIFSEFIQNYSGDGHLAFHLSLDESGRTVWLRGNYIFKFYVNNILVITKNFTIS